MNKYQAKILLWKVLDKVPFNALKNWTQFAEKNII